MRRYPAPQIEHAVKNTLINWLKDTALPDGNRDYHFPDSSAPANEKQEVIQRHIKALESGTPHEQLNALGSLVKSIQLKDTGMRITAYRNIGVSSAGSQGEAIGTHEINVPIQLKKGIKGLKMILPNQHQNLQTPDKKLIHLIAKAHLWAKDLHSGKFETIKALAKYHGVDKADISKNIRLIYLAPDIITAILDGRQPPLLNANRLRRLSGIPADWGKQRKLLGFA